MAGVRGKQVGVGSEGVSTINLADGALAANATGRAVMETDYFNAPTVADKFVAGSIPTSKLTDAADVILADGTVPWTADQSMGGNTITNLATATAQADLLPDGQVPTFTTADKDLTPSVTTMDGDTTGITLTSTPFNGGAVIVLLNGWKARLGDGTLARECYFSDDGGTTPKAFSALAAGDTLYWNGSVAGFQLAASDLIDLVYLV